MVAPVTLMVQLIDVNAPLATLAINARSPLVQLILVRMVEPVASMEPGTVANASMVILVADVKRVVSFFLIKK